MPLARKIVLHSPLSDEALLTGFVEQCLAEGVSLLAIVGPGANDLEERVDWMVVGDGSDPKRFLCTTSHPDEPLDDVLNLAKAWEADPDDNVEQVFL
ncbi:hypothetical protein [Rhizobium leguminosarum]|uniref:hypothetical protein n=1 Tax=Rhizobium leguminosarum TaxID=384 RepID=UPI0003781416|nr:hypothetical protein [Rhizobium leguminosarum]